MINIYPLRFPRFFRLFFPLAIFQKENTINNSIYLTFDDGPTREITTFVLRELKKYDAKATFFCLGDKIEKYPEILNKIINEGHQIANHTYYHLDAWNSFFDTYIEEVIKTEKKINLFTKGKKLFRPPFGHITPLHCYKLKKAGFKIILWTTIVGDFKQEIDVNKVIFKLYKETKPGDILVFHDSEKAADNLRKILPELLKKLHQKGFNFSIL